MALITIGFDDFNENEKHFKDKYGHSYMEYILKYGITESTDLEDKVLVTLSVADEGGDKPVNIHQIFVHDSKFGAERSTLIYAGGIVFLIINYKKGGKRILYKDDKSYPCGFRDCIESGDILYYAEYNGYTAKDILEKIEKCLQVHYLYHYELDEKELILLEGL